MDDSLRQHHLGWLELAQSGNEIAKGVVAYHGITAPSLPPTLEEVTAAYYGSGHVPPTPTPRASAPAASPRPRVPLADPLDPLGHRSFARNMWPMMVG